MNLESRVEKLEQKAAALPDPAAERVKAEERKRERAFLERLVRTQEGRDLARLHTAIMLKEVELKKRGEQAAEATPERLSALRKQWAAEDARKARYVPCAEVDRIGTLKELAQLKAKVERRIVKLAEVEN